MSIENHLELVTSPECDLGQSFDENLPSDKVNVNMNILRSVQKKFNHC